MSKKAYLWLFFILLAVLAGSGLALHTSIWYLWHRLPDADLKIAINWTDSSHTIVTSLYPEASGTALPDLTKRMSLAQSGSDTLLVALPAQPYLFSSHNQLINYLEQGGWSVSRHGLLIMARQGSLKAASPGISLNSPRQPLFIFQAKEGATPYFTQPMAGIAVGHGQEISIYATFGESSGDLPSEALAKEGAYSLPQNTNQLSLAMSSNNLRFIPPDLANSWTTILHDRLGFILTSPNILDELAKQQNISISIDDDHATLAIQGNPASFSDAARLWLQAEDARSNLVSRAFKLPDGTLGYEKIPGPPRPMFIGVPVKGCLPAGLAGRHDLALWLCQNADRAALGTDEKTTRGLVLRSPHQGEEEWYVAANTEALTTEPLAFFNALTATGDEKQAIIRLKLK